MPQPIYVLNGPNLNLLGTREPEMYGRQSLGDIEAACAQRAKVHGLETVFRQTNQEGILVNWVQEARDNASALILNAGAYAHTSIALLDACRAFGKPVIEVHLSNIFRREHFRRRTYVSEGAVGVIVGFGPYSYLLAIDAIAALAKEIQK
ncbi:MAG: type II 3-dehydroquinate dehydratase [Alphaproteobacteria bacterium]